MYSYLLQLKFSSLNSNLEECFQSVSNGKIKVASAITDKGIPTEAAATFEVMANNLRNIKTSIKVTKIGTFNATDTGTTINIKQYSNNWTKLNNDNFWGYAAAWAQASGGSGVHNVYSSPGLSYNASSGLLSYNRGQSGEAHVTVYSYYSSLYLIE